MNKVLEGLLVLQPYYKSEDFKINVGHDEIFVEPTDEPLSKDDINKMIGRGWFQPDADCDDDGEFHANHYDVDEWWSIYV